MWYLFCYACDHEWETLRKSRCPNCRSRNYSNVSKRQAEAGRIVAQALRNGTLKRRPCRVCGTKKRIQAHHDDYTKPLKVRWLCPKHHGERHAEMRRLGINPKRSAFSENRLIPRDMTPAAREGYMVELYSKGQEVGTAADWHRKKILPGRPRKTGKRKKK